MGLFSFSGLPFTYWLDNTNKKVALMVLVKSHIPSRRLNNFKIPSNIQTIAFERNFRKKIGTCVNLQCSVSGKQILFLLLDKSVRILLNSVWKSYHSWLFNIGAENKTMKDFLQEHMFSGVPHRVRLVRFPLYQFLCMKMRFL